VGGFDETFSLIGPDDWNFWISLLEAGYRGAIIPEVLYEYRARADSLQHSSMREPEYFARACSEIAQRHAATYARYLSEFIADMARQRSELTNWADEQRRTITWLERERAAWEQTARGQRAALDDQSRSDSAGVDHGVALSAATEIDRWRGEAEQNARVVEEQRTYIVQMEGAKLWLEEERQKWAQAAGKQSAALEGVRQRLSELERANSWLGEERSKWERVAAEQSREIERQRVELEMLRARVAEVDQADTLIRQQRGELSA
jgi:hypothetical protein